MSKQHLKYLKNEVIEDVTAQRIREYEAIVAEMNKAQSEPGRLGLTKPGDYELFTVVQDFAHADGARGGGRGSCGSIAHGLGVSGSFAAAGTAPVAGG